MILIQQDFMKMTKVCSSNFFWSPTANIL